jgi:hypothetical protein
MLTIGYHTLQDLFNVDDIEKNGPIKCETKAAWLGHGYYFWDADISWGHNFGKSRYGEEYMIFEAEIVLNKETYDLYGNVLHKLEFKSLWEELRENGHFKPGEEITVPKLIEYLKRNIGFDYNSIRAADNPDSQSVLSFGGKRGEFMYLNERVQICLITKKNLALQSFRVVYPDKYL